MMNDSVNPNRIGDDPVGSTRMTTQSSPPGLAPKTAQRTSLGHRLQRALTGGPNRRFPGLHPPPGGAASTSLLANRRISFPILALLAAVTVSLLFLLPGGPLHAQDGLAIEYPEKEERPVATYTATDPELAGAIEWSLAGVDAEHFEIGESSGVLTFAEVPDYEMAADDDTNNEYLVTVVATDADGIASNEEVTVEVTNEDENGTVTLSAVAPYPGVVLTTTHTDLDGQITSPGWQWSRSRSKTSSNYADIEDAEAEAYSPESGDVGFYLRATVTYNDGEGEGKSAMATSAHTVQAINLPNAAPEFTDDDADADGNQTTRMVEENTDAGEDVGLPVEADADDNDILTYTLGTTNDDGAFNIDQATGQIKTKDDLNADAAGQASYRVTVTATDPGGENDTITVTITVTGVNETPDITAEDVDYLETTATTPNTDIVANFSATDPEGAGAVTLDLSGADASLFTLANGVLTFNSPPNYEAPGDADEDNTYELTVGARDFDGNRGTEDIEVKVTNEDENGTVTLSAVQPRVGVAVTASLTDIDGPVSGVTWQWSSNNTAIEDATSDTYTPVADDDGDRLTATATYTDPQGAEKTAEVESAAVAADTRNKAPVFDDQDDDEDGTQNTETTRTVAENTDAPNPVSGAAVTATDPNAGAPLNDTVSYSLGGDDASSFDIGLTTGQITVRTGTDLDYETKTTYMVTVIATDSYGESSSIAVTITVTPVNEGPEVTGQNRVEYPEKEERPVATYTATDPELAGAIEWSLAGVDAEHFEIGESSGVLTFAEVPDYEMAADDDTNNEYLVTVVATDADGIASNEEVTVEVTNEDENGTVTLSAVAPYPGVVLTTTHTDLDGQITSPGWQWSRSRSKTSSNYADIEDAEAEAYSPESGDVGFYLRATVTYNDGEGEGKSAMATSAHTVQAINLPNAAPEFTDDDADADGNQTTRMVEENTDAGEDVGLPVEADADDNDILTYTLGTTNDDGAFNIDQATGQIKTKDDLNADAAGQASYRVTVTATDPGGENDTITVTITVTGVNETPDITAEDVDYLETTATTPNTDIVANFSATDPEGAGAVTLDLSGADASLFTLANGVLTFNSPPNYEAPGDADEDNTYELTVGARDFDGNRGTEDIEVKVTNEDENGTVTLSAVQPRVGVAVTASLTDIDGPVSGVTWQWSSNNTAIEDATSDTYTPVADDDGDRLTATATYTDPQGAEKTAEVESAAVAADTRNKAPVFDDQDDDEDGTQNTETTRTVAENTDAPNPVSGAAVTATDPNAGAPLNDTVSYSLGGDDASSFDIGLTTGQITVRTGTDLDYETKTTYMVTVIATDSYGESASIAVTITVTPVNEGPTITVTDVDENVAPEFAGSEDGARSVAENTMAGEDIGAPVAASDADDAALTYTLSGTDAASFDIDQATGQLKTKADLDYETKASYAVTVTATDGDTASDSIDVTITVTDVDENLPPEFPSAATTREVAENTMAGEDIGAPVAASDADDAALTYTLSGTDAASFDIDQATGQLKTKADLDYETKASYAVTVTATDGDTASDSIDVAITVADVDEAGTGDPLVDEYDANDNGMIEKSEVLKAINDYLFGEGDEAISKPEVLRLINIYLFGG